MASIFFETLLALPLMEVLTGYGEIEFSIKEQINLYLLRFICPRGTITLKAQWSRPRTKMDTVMLILSRIIAFKFIFSSIFVLNILIIHFVMVCDEARYYVTWFKTGSPPAIVKEAIYYTHRNQQTDAPYLFNNFKYKFTTIFDILLDITPQYRPTVLSNPTQPVARSRTSYVFTSHFY